MAFPSFLDACTLYGLYVRDTLLRIAEAGAFRALPGLQDSGDRGVSGVWV